jgi:hypothetical protein
VSVSAPYRNVFFFEVLPDHWVQVNMKGDFDSDIWQALKGFLDRHATQPWEGAKHQFRQEDQGRWVWKQSCQCDLCLLETERLVTAQRME